MNRRLYLFAVLMSMVGVDHLESQECVTYKLVPRTTYKTRPIELATTVNETVMETQKVVTYKPVWTRETRQRKTTSYKPIVTTSERVERYLVRRPIIETSYVDREIEETSYETVTQMQEKRYLVETPVVETQLREEKYIVRKPVTTTVMQSEDYLTYKPTTVTETQLMPSANIRNELRLQTGRNRLQRLQPGCYVDPQSGRIVYRGRGLYWAREQNLVVQPTIETTLVPQQVARTTFSPEKITVQKPVEVTQFVDEIQKRQVPVQVATTSKKIHVLKIPVTVQKPVTKIRTEKIPVENVSYREEVYTRKVPVTETKYQRVENVEPYEVEVCQWVSETSEVQVPRTVARRANYSVEQVYPVTEWIRVPVDAFGNALSTGDVVATEIHPAIDYQIARRIASAPVRRSNLSSAENTTTVQKPGSLPRVIVGDPVIVRKLDDDENLEPSSKPNSVFVPPTDPQTRDSKTQTVPVQERETANEPDTSEADGSPQLEAPPLEETTATTIEIQPAPVPTSPGPTTETLDLEAEQADIETRPGSENPSEDLNLGGPST